jgi:hypothetical protein
VAKTKTSMPPKVRDEDEEKPREKRATVKPPTAKTPTVKPPPKKEPPKRRMTVEVRAPIVDPDRPSERIRIIASEAPGRMKGLSAPRIKAAPIPREEEDDEADASPPPAAKPSKTPPRRSTKPPRR